MRKLLLFMYIVSLLIVIIGFYGMNFFTETIVKGANGGGNGNPALFIPVFLMPFFFYFVYGTTELSMQLIEKYKKSSTLILSIILSVIAIMGIVIYTVEKSRKIREMIVQKQSNFESISQISLLNTFSNDIFFNALTFVMVLLVCYVVAAGWSVYRRPK